MEELYPLTAATTLSELAEASGLYYPSPITALGLDPAEELLWAGTQDGRVTVLHAPSLDRHSGAYVHPDDHAVVAVVPTGGIGGGALSVSATLVAYHSAGCVKRWGHREEGDGGDDPLTCAVVDPHALSGSGRAYVGRVSPEIIQVDLGTGRVSLRADVTGSGCTHGTAVMHGGAPRGLLACGGFGGELVLRDPRGKMRADVQLSTPAHAAGVSTIAARGDLVATCGYTTDRAGSVVVDPFVKVVDVRMGCRVLNVLQFPAGPAGVLFNPKHGDCLLVTSASGLVQAMDAGGQGGSGFQSHMIQLEGHQLTAAAMSNSGEIAAFGDTQGLIHIWSVNDAPQVNLYSSATEVPPRRPACVERSFAAAEASHWSAGPAGGSHWTADTSSALHSQSAAHNDAGEHCAVGPAPFQLALDPSAPPLSYLDPAAVIAVGRCPHVIPKEVLRETRLVDFVGYAPNPHYTRGGSRGLAYRAAAPLQNKRAESRSAVEDAKRAAMAASKQPGGASLSPLPTLYHRVEVRLSASRARFEEFDFSLYNRTRLPGLVNDLANCYVNPVLQMLHFVPELRARLLMGHTCEREFCLTCELSFLSHMLSQPPTAQGGSHGMSSITAQPLNFLRTLRQVREAAALGLIEGKDELEARLDQSYARRIQAFQRFILEQLHKEEAGKEDREKPGREKVKAAAGSGKSERGGNKGGGKGSVPSSTSGDAGDVVCGGVETLFALSSKQTHKCAQCSREDIRPVRSFQTDLQYPDKVPLGTGTGTETGPTFASCLARSLSTSQEVRAWCEGHQAYTRMRQTRTPTRLPQVMSINLGMRDAGDLRWWGVDVTQLITSEKASSPVEAHWLPQYVHVCTRDTGVAVTQASEDLGALDTERGGVTYELTALVCLARRPAEEEDDDAPGGGRDETGAKKLSGHLVSFLKVTPPYVEKRGQFAAAPYIPGTSPGVSPIPIGGRHPTAARAAAAAAIGNVVGVGGSGRGGGVAASSAAVAGGLSTTESGGGRDTARETPSTGPAPSAPSTPMLKSKQVAEEGKGESAEEGERASECTADEGEPDEGNTARRQLEATATVTGASHWSSDASSTSPGQSEAAAAAAAATTKAAQFAAALAAGEAMYGAGSGFDTITPSQMFTPSAAGGGGGADSVPGTDWLLFNDFSINPVAPREVTRLYGQVKLPCLCMYTRVDRPAPPPLPPSPITANMFRRLTLGASLPPRSPFRPFDFESAGETPGPGTILGIDAEFVALAPAVRETQADGSEVVVQSMRLGLARVSVVRGDSGPRRLVPVMDDYIRAVEPVYDYLTRFSGLVPGDLDPAVSTHAITRLKHAYLKLRYLVGAGCIFVGHGLKQDFKMINIVVPPAQIVDTVELFHFKRQRKLSLRFLASYLLGLDIQQETHDSIEDARTAVRLYDKYLELVREGNFQAKLLEIYRYGKQYGYTGENRPAEHGKPGPGPGQRGGGAAVGGTLWAIKPGERRGGGGGGGLVGSMSTTDLADMLPTRKPMPPSGHLPSGHPPPSPPPLPHM